MSEREQPERRARLFMDRVITVATLAAVVSWLWWQRAPVQWIAPAAICATLAAVTILFGSERHRRVAEGVLFVAALIAIRGFYVHQPGVLISRSMRLVLSASVALIAGSHLLRWLARDGGTTWRRWPLGAGLLLSMGVAADLVFWSPGSWFERVRFHPWATVDRPGLDTYIYANRQERFVKDFNGVVFAQRKPEATYRIVLAGASTMWGMFLDQNDRPAPVLRGLLSRVWPGRNVEVITVAWPAKYALNEMVDMAVTVPHWSPDLVASWDGYNEVWFGDDANKYEGQPVNGWGVDDQTRASPFKGLLFAHTYAGRRRYEQMVTGATYPPRSQLNADYEPPRFFAYVRRIARLLAAERIPYVFGATPNVFEKDLRSPEEQAFPESAPPGTNFPERRLRAATEIRAAGQHSYDPMPPLQRSETLFLDTVHLNAKGVRLSMEALASEIERIEATRRATAARK